MTSLHKSCVLTSSETPAFFAVTPFNNNLFGTISLHRAGTLTSGFSEAIVTDSTVFVQHNVCPFSVHRDTKPAFPFPMLQHFGPCGSSTPSDAGENNSRLGSTTMA